MCMRADYEMYTVVMLHTILAVHEHTWSLRTLFDMLLHSKLLFVSLCICKLGGHFTSL